MLHHIPCVCAATRPTESEKQHQFIVTSLTAADGQSKCTDAAAAKWKKHKHISNTDPAKRLQMSPDTQVDSDVSKHLRGYKLKVPLKPRRIGSEKGALMSPLIDSSVCVSAAMTIKPVSNRLATDICPLFWKKKQYCSWSVSMTTNRHYSRMSHTLTHTQSPITVTQHTPMACLQFLNL